MTDRQSQAGIDTQSYFCVALAQKVSSLLSRLRMSITEYMTGIADASNKIGFCFSYPIEIFPNKDGRVLFFSKEIKADEVAGNMIGEHLNAAISSSGNADKKNIILLNDTVATLLAGRADVKGMSFDTYIGFGKGRFNGVDGATIRFVFTDEGS